jgi:hypothetical protein
LVLLKLEQRRDDLIQAVAQKDRGNDTTCAVCRHTAQQHSHRNNAADHDTQRQGR